MITRPLDLASRLQPAPRSFDALFYVNVGLLALFFALFGSRFVLAPGLGLDFRLPSLVGAKAGAARSNCYLSVKGSGQILTADGLLNTAQLPEWLKAEAAKEFHPALLIEASEAVPIDQIMRIYDLAMESGFVSVHVAAAEPAAPDERMR